LANQYHGYLPFFYLPNACASVVGILSVLYEVISQIDPSNFINHPSNLSVYRLPTGSRFSISVGGGHNVDRSHGFPHTPITTLGCSLVVLLIAAKTQHASQNHLFRVWQLRVCHIHANGVPPILHRCAGCVLSDESRPLCQLDYRTLFNRPMFRTQSVGLAYRSEI